MTKHKRIYTLKHAALTAILITLAIIYAFFRISPQSKAQLKLDPFFLEKAMSVRNFGLDELPISISRKAILYLTENFKAVASCPSCNKVQQKIPERAITVNILDKLSPCNFLVFGVGFDSIMWTALNGGRTIFLEDNELWIEKVKKNAPFLEIYKVDYTIREKHYPQSLERFRKLRNCSSLASIEECFLMLQLPKEIRNISWDIIMVDAPNGGGGSDAPTRQMSIFTSAVLARKSKSGAHVLVHDTHREIERIFSDEFLCHANLIEELERSARLYSGSRLALRHYYIESNIGKTKYC